MKLAILPCVFAAALMPVAVCAQPPAALPPIRLPSPSASPAHPTSGVDKFSATVLPLAFEFAPETATIQQEPIPPGPPIAAPSQALELADIEQIALSSNPTLVQAAARVRAARGTCVQVGLYPNPTVGYQGVEIGNEGTAGQQGIFLGQEFVFGRKLRLNRNVAALAVRQAEQDLAAQRLRVLNDVRISFYDTLVAQRRVEFAEELLVIGERALKATEQLLQGAEASRVELLQSRIALNTSRILATNAENALLSAWRRLAAVIGAPDMARVTLVGNVEAGLQNLVWDESRQQLIEFSPELAVARLGVDQARWALDRARAEPIPNLDVQFTLQRDNVTADEIAGLQAVLPVPVFNRNQGAISRAQAELTIARGEVRRVELDLQQRLAVAYERYLNAKKQVDLYASEILPDAKASLDLVADGYRLGEIPFLLLLTSQRTFLQVNLAYLDALLDLRQSSVAIEGLLLTGNLNTASPPSIPPGRSYGASPVIPGMGR